MQRTDIGLRPWYGNRTRGPESTARIMWLTDTMMCWRVGILRHVDTTCNIHLHKLRYPPGNAKMYRCSGALSSLHVQAAADLLYLNKPLAPGVRKP
jgi:hypothetical protein